MACESKKISELTEACLVNPNDILPIVQDGTNKYVKVKDLLKGKCGDDTQDDCCCSKALSKAITALDFSRTAMDLANKAFDKACLVSTRLAALEEKVNEHDTLICNIQSNITRIFNQLEKLGNNLKLKIEYSSDTDNNYYKFVLGNSTIDTLPVPIPTTNFEAGDGKPADAKEVWRRLRDFKGEVSKNLTFRAGRFGADDTIHDSEYYNGLNPRTVNIPTRLGHLTDVNASNPSSGDVLYYDGTKWVNVPIDTLIAQNLNCDAIKACFSTENFKVAPLVVTFEYNERVANFAVTSSGAWKIQKVTSGDNVFTASILDNIHLNPGTNLPLVITANSDNTTGQNREVEWDVIPWITVPGLIETQRIKVIQKPQSAPPTPTEITVTPRTVTTTEGTPISTDLTAGTTCTDNTLLIDSTNLVSGITANVTNNNTKIHVEVAATVPAGTYSFTVSDNCGSTPVTVTVRVNPVGLVTVTYVGSNVNGLPSGGEELATIGSDYTHNNIQPILGYEIVNVEFIPAGGTFNNGTVSIPNILTDVEVRITTRAEGSAVLTVTPTSLEIEPEGTTNPEIISVSTTCTTPGITINDDNLPSGIDVNLNSEQTEIEVEVASSVAAGDYTFIVSDNCGSTPVTVTITKKDGKEVNLFENVNFSNKKFNAFGVVEERFNNSGQISLDAGVNDPYRAETYRNGSMYYLADLGSWEDISDNIDPGLPINLTDTLIDLITEVNEGRLDLNWIKNTSQVRDRLSAIKENTNLVYCSNYTLPITDGDIIESIPAEYEQKSGAANTFPFYIVIAEDTSSISINTTSDLWDAHVYVQLWCLPTNFLVSHEENEVEQAHYEWYDTSHYHNQLIGILWEYDNYRMETDAPTGTEREGYKLDLSYLPKHSIDSLCDIIYPDGITSKFGITYGFVSNNSDLTVSLNPTIAAFTYSEMNGKTIPNYSVKVYDNNDTLILNVSYSITLPNNANYELHITFPDNDLLHPLNLVYTMKITANSTNPADYPSLTLTYKVFPTNLGNLTINWIGANPTAEGHLDRAGYYTEFTQNGYYNPAYSNGLPSKAGFSYVGVIPDLISSNNCTITWDRGDGQVITLPVYTSTNRTTEPSDINLERQQYTTDILTCVNLDITCPKTGFALRNTTYYLSSSLNIIEVYIPEVALTTNINVTFN